MYIPRADPITEHYQWSVNCKWKPPSTNPDDWVTGESSCVEEVQTLIAEVDPDDSYYTEVVTVA